MNLWHVKTFIRIYKLCPPENDVKSSKGPVGIGTDQPTTALAVSGDIQYTGSLFHPSDGRLKENIVE
uniref:Uncharacterized protein n=1 Tax=Romanomermis culicivorax TaxID=13658 RepID=A0A915KI67_ROMCU